MDVPGETSRVNGENVTKDILKELTTYRTSTSLSDCTDGVKNRIRKLSDKIKIEMNGKYKPEDLLNREEALKAVIRSLYLHAETEEQHVLYTICLFTY